MKKIEKVAPSTVQVTHDLSFAGNATRRFHLLSITKKGYQTQSPFHNTRGLANAKKC